MNSPREGDLLSFLHLIGSREHRRRGREAPPWRRGACYSSRATVAVVLQLQCGQGFPPSFYWWPAPHGPPGPRPEAQVAEELQKPPFFMSNFSFERFLSQNKSEYYIKTPSFSCSIALLKETFSRFNYSLPIYLFSPDLIFLGYYTKHRRNTERIETPVHTEKLSPRAPKIVALVVCKGTSILLALAISLVR